MNVFVVGTGRCGTVTFSRACAHLTNYTSGHETRVRKLAGRLDYLPNHIETDPRLSWHLGQLTERYPDAFYVHLRRQPEEVVASLLRRWDTSRFLRFMRLALVHRDEQDYATRASRIALCELYVQTVTANVQVFLGPIPDRSMTIWLHTAKTDFRTFWYRIGGSGDFDKATAEWDVRYNASRRTA
jgi:hypothetical protein